MPKPRKNKTKKEIVSDIQLVADADRRRALIKDILFPFLVSIDESTAYSKIFVQSFAGLLEGVYEEKRKKTTIGSMQAEIKDKLDTLFVLSDKDQKREYERYQNMALMLKDISIQDFAYAAELPRYIDGFLMKDSGKKPIKDIPIEEILGK